MVNFRRLIFSRITFLFCNLPSLVSRPPTLSAGHAHPQVPTGGQTDLSPLPGRGYSRGAGATGFDEGVPRLRTGLGGALFTGQDQDSFDSSPVRLDDEYLLIFK